jgi:crossover junction endodeoxyribonuclease RuvC
MIILGIDPGFERLGIAIIQKEKGSKETLVYSNCFKTKKEESFGIRLAQIGHEIESILETYKPDMLSIETLFLSTNKKTGMHVAEARGVVVYECAKRNMTICEYTPLQVKTAITGYGKSDKKQVMFMIPKILTIPTAITSDDELDAVGIALTAVAYNKL